MNDAILVNHGAGAAGLGLAARAFGHHSCAMQALLLVASTLAAVACSLALAENNGLARTPPVSFASTVDAALLRLLANPGLSQRHQRAAPMPCHLRSDPALTAPFPAISCAF
jgi:hypothetical protein